jgi:hypothetical protein
MNISFTSSDQFTACKGNSLDEGMILWTAHVIMGKLQSMDC